MAKTGKSVGDLTMNDDKIRFGIIGTNKISDMFLEGARHVDEFVLTAVYSRSEETATAFALRYHAPHIFTNLKDMAESDLIDAVYIASPNALHCEQAILFLNHKKHVLCEKAFASNTKEVIKMIETAKKNDVILMEAMITTQLPNFKVVESHLHRIGKIRRYVGSYCQYSSKYDSYKAGIIMNTHKPELSNGSLMDIGVYCIHPMIFLFGKPISVKANALMLESGVDGQGSLILEYEHMEGLVIFSKIANSQSPSEIQGEEGNIYIQSMRGFETVKIVFKDGRVEDLSQLQVKESMCYEIEKFINMIQNKDLVINAQLLQTSKWVMECMDEARKQMGLVYPADTATI
jgi:scyllo-inositol 2-dehydrogenase (NADP+)